MAEHGISQTAAQLRARWAVRSKVQGPQLIPADIGGAEKRRCSAL
jgi:hypothetical protein